MAAATAKDGAARLRCGSSREGRKSAGWRGRGADTGPEWAGDRRRDGVDGPERASEGRAPKNRQDGGKGREPGNRRGEGRGPEGRQDEGEAAGPEQAAGQVEEDCATRGGLQTGDGAAEGAGGPEELRRQSGEAVRAAGHDAGEGATRVQEGVEVPRIRNDAADEEMKEGAAEGADNAAPDEDLQAAVRTRMGDAATRSVVNYGSMNKQCDRGTVAKDVADRLDEWRRQAQADADAWKARQEDRDVATPEALAQAVEAEQQRRDAAKAKVLRVKAAEAATAVTAVIKAAADAEQARSQRERYRRRRERRRLRDLVAGKKAGADVTPDDVAREVGQPVAAPAVETSDDPVTRSRARRRQEKRVRKAKAKERRELLAALAELEGSGQGYFGLDKLRRDRGPGGHHGLSKAEAEEVGHALPQSTEVMAKSGKRRRQVGYAYHSGSLYAGPRVQQGADDRRPMRVGQMRAVRAPAVATLPTATVEVCGMTRAIKLDTGAQYCVAGEKWQAYGERLDILPPVDLVEGFTGALSKVLGVWRFTFRTQYEQEMTVDALIVSGAPTEFLLGEDWMLEHGVKIDFTACEMKWYEDGAKKVVPFDCSDDAARSGQPTQVRLVRAARVTTNTYRRVELAVAAPEGTTGLFLPTHRAETHMMLAPTLTTVRGGKVVVPILSLVGSKVKLPAREALGTWSPTTDDMEMIDLAGDLSTEKVAEWVRTLSEKETPLSNEDELKLGDMTEDDRELLLTMLRHYPTLLEPREGCPPMTTLGVEHEIHTGAEAPIKLRARRHAQEEHRVIDDNVETMLKDGVVEESNGTWAFPVVLVKKKDESVRFCIDYRALNAITKRDVYPLPRIDDTLDHLHGARLFTSLDLHSGYWQVPVAAKDRDKTGFVTRRGLFRFVRMPFGLANAPSTFQRMMDAVLRGLTWQTCLVYLDDVIVFTKGEMGRHVVELAAVLERLSRAGLSLKAKKCTFVSRKLEYLGHELDEEGVRPMESLVDSVQRFPVPTDAIEVKRFVHMAGYYRRFVPNFGSKAAPLTRLLRKDAVWRWAEPQQEAFERLKTALTERPVLAYPDFSKPFKLVTDASQVGLGAALTQDQGRGEQPVAYASKVNSPTVAKYSITDLECAAVVWAVKLFRPYLYGQHFELVTDHAALKWLMTSKDLTGRLHRWSLQLQEYDFAVVYRPGSSNVVADALSRAPVGAVRAAAGDEEASRRPGSNEGQLTDDEIRTEQAKDKTVQKLKRDGRYGDRKIEEAHGLVCIRGEDRGRRVVLPATLWAKVLRESHDSIFACHLRTPQTYARIAAVYWWPGMGDQVKHWVQACRDCGTRKTKAKEVIPPLRSQHVGDVGDRWALDVAGPLPVTNGGNRYVVAAVDYATRYAVAVAVPTHTAKDIARFIMDRLVLVFGPMRELAMDGAPELNGRVIDELVGMLQAKQLTPVPYRPALLGLVERYHRTWKDMVALYVNEEQSDWDRWLTCAAYAYNGARHSGTGISPNELMMGRRLRAPNELLRTSGVTQTGPHAEYHRALIENMAKTAELARVALAKGQVRRERYYNKRVRHTTEFEVGDRVWVLKPPRGRGITKLTHQWVGPAKIKQDTGFDNWEVEREDTGERMIVHCSFLVSCRCPSDSLGSVADRILKELVEDDEAAEIAGTGARHPSEGTEGQEAEGVGGNGTPVVPEGRQARDAPNHRPGDYSHEITDARTGALTPDGSEGGQQQRTPPEIAEGSQRPEQRPVAVQNRQQKRKAQQAADADATAAKQRRRREADAAREARVTRRQEQLDRSSGAARAGGVPHQQGAPQPASDERGSDGPMGASVVGDPGGRRPTGQRDQEAGGGQQDQGKDGGQRGQPEQREQQEEGEQPGRQVGAVAEMLRGRGRPRLPEPMPRLLQVETAGHIVEHARRRARNRAGRYCVEHEVEYSAGQGEPKSRRWLTAAEFEALQDAGKIEDDLTSGDGV